MKTTCQILLYTSYVLDYKEPTLCVCSADSVSVLYFYLSNHSQNFVFSSVEDRDEKVMWGGVVVGHPVPSPTKQETYGLSDIWGHYKPSLSFKVWYSAGLQIKIFVFNMNKKTFSLWMPDNRNNDVKEQELLSPQAMIDLTFIPDSPKDRSQGVWSQGGKSGREYTVRTVYIGEKNKYVQHYVSLPNWESLKL